MVYIIIISALLVFLLIGILQKHKEKQFTISENQIEGGYRNKFPILVKLLTEEFSMELVADTGDNFFYQIKLYYNNSKQGFLRIGRRIDYTNKIELYTEFVDEENTKLKGMPVILADDRSESDYKTFIKMSLSKVFSKNISLMDVYIRSLVLDDSDTHDDFKVYVHDEAADNESELLEDKLPYRSEEEEMYLNEWHKIVPRYVSDTPYTIDRIDPHLFVNNLRYLEYDRYLSGEPAKFPPTESVRKIGRIPSYFPFHYAAGYPDLTNWFLNFSNNLMLPILLEIKQNPNAILNNDKQLHWKIMLKIYHEYKKTVSKNFECGIK